MDDRLVIILRDGAGIDFKFGMIWDGIYLRAALDERDIMQGIAK